MGGRAFIATYAWVVRRSGRTLRQESGLVCLGSRVHNFMAEYGAVVAALRWILAAGLEGESEIDVYSDCQYVVDRLTGRVGLQRSSGVIMLHQAVLQCANRLRRKGHKVRFHLVNRGMVQTSHRLCRLESGRRIGTGPTPPGLGVKRFLRGPKPKNRAAAWLQRPALAGEAD